MLYKARRKIEYRKARTRAKVEHAVRVIKRQFGYVKVPFRGLTENTVQQTTPSALSKSVDGSKTADGYGRVALNMKNQAKTPPTSTAPLFFQRITLFAFATLIFELPQTRGELIASVTD